MFKYLIILLLIPIFISCEKLNGDIDNLNDNPYDKLYVGDHITLDYMDSVYVSPVGFRLDIYFNVDNNLRSDFKLEYELENHEFTQQSTVNNRMFKIRLSPPQISGKGKTQKIYFFMKGNDRGGKIGELNVLYDY